jgi:hypothetical protein
LAGVFDVTASPYSAVGDGSTDDAAAFIAAINAANAVSSAHSRAQVRIPGLPYKIIGGLPTRRFVDLIGAGTPTLIGDGTSNMFDFLAAGANGPAWRNNIENIQFANCAKAIYCPTANADGGIINVRGCGFGSDVAVGAHTGSYDGSRSCVLNMENCWSDADRFVVSFCDKLNLRDNTITYQGQNHEVVSCMGSCNFTGNLWTPEVAAGTASTMACWIAFHAADSITPSTVSFDARASLIVTGDEFGTEHAGITAVFSDAAVQLDAVPGLMWHVNITMRNCKGGAGTVPTRRSLIVLFAPPWATTGPPPAGGMADYIDLRGTSLSRCADYVIGLDAGFLGFTPVRGRFPVINLDPTINKCAGTDVWPRLALPGQRDALAAGIVHPDIRNFVRMC